MKKFILTFAIGLFIFSCQHDELESLSNSDDLTARRSIDNVLSFDSNEEYLNILEDNSLLNQKNTNYVSLASLLDKYESDKENERAISLKNEADTIYADYGILPKILNEDKIVKIGKYFIKVALEEERVYVLEDSYQAEYNDLVTNIPNDHIQLFSTEDEVLTRLANNETSRFLKKCDDRRARKKKDLDIAKNGRKKRLKAKVAYQKAGIYFSLMLEGKTQKRRFWIWWRDNDSWIRVRYYYSVGVRCGKEYWANPYITAYDDGNGKVNVRVYEGFVGLKYYDLEANFESSHGWVDHPLHIRDY